MGSNSNTSSLLPITLTSATDISGIPPAGRASYWDEMEELRYDCIITGGGIVGLSAAIELKKREPQARILILERDVLATGASTRNAGFTCFGSLTEILSDIAVMGEERAIAQVKDRWEGLQLLRRSLGDDAIGFRQAGNYELISEELLPQLQHLERINHLLHPIFGQNVFLLKNEDIEHYGFSKQYVKALVLNQFEGELDSGKMMKALREKAYSLGIRIRYGSEAERPREVADGLEIPVQSKDGKMILFRAKKAAICVNAYTSKLIPEFEIKPGRGQIIVTEPLKLKRFPPCHMGQGYWYFRTLEDECNPGMYRILLGGGRNLDFDEETTTELETTAKILGPLKKILSEVIIPSEEPRIDYSWAGLMGFSADHLPKIEMVPGQPNVVVGFGCNGMGVARGSHTGQRVAQLLVVNKILDEKEQVKQELLAAHKALFDQDKQGWFGFFRNTNLNPAWDLKEMIQHGMNNNRTRQICIEKGWLSSEGNILDTAPQCIQDEFTKEEVLNPVVFPA